MTGISNLKTLLKTMKPYLVNDEYVFCTISESRFSELKLIPLLMFVEEEGITLIIRKEIAENSSLGYSGIWSWIKLSVHSDLTAIGFLAAITDKLAKNEISVNVVSAFYHDHLFIPVDKAKQAILLLEELTTSQ